MLQKIQSEIKQAMIDKNVDKRDVLRQVLAKAQMEAKESHMEITDEITQSSVKKEIKQLNQTKNTVPKETDLYKSTEYKLSVLEEYMPKMLTKSEVRRMVYTLLHEKEDLTFGEKMKLVMEQLSGKAENSLIAKVVKEHENRSS